VSTVTGVIVLAVIAFVLVVVIVAVRWRQPRSLVLRRPRPAPPGSHEAVIRRAAEADVEAVEEDDQYFSPDAPGQQQDDL
jgi:hypothetical protein